MSLRHLAIACVLVICVPAVARGDEPRPLPRPATSLDTGDGVIRMPGGFEFHVPRGSLILQPDARSAMDLETKRLQDAETRLEAENRSLKKTAAEWQPGWKLLLSATLVGLVGGAYLGYKL